MSLDSKQDAPKFTKNALTSSKVDTSISAPPTHSAVQSASVALTEEQVWLQIYCAVISSNVNCSAQAGSIADKGLEEFKAKMRS